MFISICILPALSYGMAAYAGLITKKSSNLIKRILKGLAHLSGQNISSYQAEFIEKVNADGQRIYNEIRNDSGHPLFPIIDSMYRKTGTVTRNMMRLPNIRIAKMRRSMLIKLTMQESLLLL